MQAVVFVEPGRVEVREVPDPQVLDPTDAVVRVTRSAICGTDLHPYRGHISGFEPGVVLGHEFAGTVVAVGDQVDSRVGDRVYASDIIACGRCARCAAEQHYQCRSASLFGYGRVVGDAYDGGQAEFVRVPFADVVLAPVPDGVSDEAAVFLGDLLPTAYVAARNAAVSAGCDVVVVGAGPLGLLTGLVARVLGAASVAIADPDPDRRARALEHGLEAIRPDALAGREAGSVVEAVGSEAALAAAVLAAGPRGHLAIVGSPHSESAAFPTQHAFARELTIRFTVGDPIAVREQATRLVTSGRLDPSVVVSDRLPLSAAATAYERFDSHAAFKVILAPG